MKFLVDRCAGHRLADWLRGEGHDVVEVRGLILGIASSLSKPLLQKEF